MGGAIRCLRGGHARLGQPLGCHGGLARVVDVRPQRSCRDRTTSAREVRLIQRQWPVGSSPRMACCLPFPVAPYLAWHGFDTSSHQGPAETMSLRLPLVRAASGMRVASVIKWSLLPTLPRSTGRRLVLGPLSTPGCESRRPRPGRSPGRARSEPAQEHFRSRCHTPASGHSPGRRQHVMPEPKLGSYGRFSQAISVCAKTGSPGAPAGPDADSARHDECDVQLSTAVVRCPITREHLFATKASLQVMIP